MAVPTDWGDPTVVPELVAEHIHTSATRLGIDLSRQQLTDAVSEITPETQTLGSALLQVQLIDPDWSLIRSGIITRDSDGFLPPIDVNFPEGTDVWWRLAMEDHSAVSSDSTQPNLTLTFQQRIVTYLMQCWGPLGWPRGKTGSTRAQFIKMLVDRMPSELPAGVAGPGPLDVKFVCPAINEIQPVALSNIFGTEAITSHQATARKAGINKMPALTSAAKVTIRGQKPSREQIQAVNDVLGTGISDGAPTVALIAAAYAATWESNFSPHADNGKFWGVLSAAHTAFSQLDTTGMASAFFNGGSGFQAGGAIHLAKSGVTNPIEIAVRVEVASIWPANAYAHETGYPGDRAAVAEATGIVNAFGGGSITGLSGSAEPQSDIAQLTRGTSENPDEDSWTCMQRLAGEVNWSLFTSPSPAPGVFGNFLYYMDGPTLVAQRPSLYVELSDDGTTWSATDPDSGKVIAGDGVISNLHGTTDNTTFQFMETRKVKGKVQRKTAIRRPQTPTQVMFNMICGTLEFNAGDVFVFHNAGPQDGRWIVEDVTQNALADLFAQFTLGPPTYPYPEPQANSVTALGTGVALPSSSNPAGGGVNPVDLSGYVNPLARVKLLAPSRIDMGVDYTGHGPLLALGNGTVFLAASSGVGWPRYGGTGAVDQQGGFVGYTLADGPFKGKHVYVAENIQPTVQTGQPINAGDTIAQLYQGGANMETGWATGQGSGTLAAANNHQAPGSDPGAWSSIEGRNFNELLKALGAPSGILTPNPPRQSMPAGWPTLGSSASGKRTPRSNRPLGETTPLSPTQKGVETVLENTPVQIGGIFNGLFTSGGQSTIEPGLNP